MTGSPNGSVSALALWIATVILLSSIPYFVLAGGAAADETYNWLLPPYPEDGLAYTAWVEQAAEGALLFKVKFTQIPHRALLFHPFFLVVGWLSAITGWQAGFALFLGRVVATGLFLLVLYRVSALFLAPGAERWVGLSLVTFSSGLGIRLLPGGQPSADLWMPEINTLWSMTWNPVFVVALTLMVAAIGLVTSATRSDESATRLRPFFVAGALTGLLAFIHAYDVVVVGVVVAVVTALRLRNAMMRPLLAYSAITLPATAIQWLIANLHPVLAAHGTQGAMPSPSVLSYAAAMGLPGLMAAYGTYRAARSGSLARFTPLIVWIVSSLLLAYAPVWFQRKMIMGIHIPICMVAAVGVCDLARRLSFGRKAVFAGVAIAIVAVSSTTHLKNARSTRLDVHQDRTAYYLGAPLHGALQFLDDRTDPDEVVLAHYQAARHIPGTSGNTVTLGHWAQSVDLETHMRWLTRLFRAGGTPSDRERLEALRDSSIDYILVDPPMRAEWLRGSRPRWLDDAGEVVYDEAGIRIIEVRRPDQSPG